MPNREKISEMQPALPANVRDAPYAGKYARSIPLRGIHMYLICRVDPNSPPPTIWQICLHPSGMTCAENELPEKVIDTAVHRPHSVRPWRAYVIGEIH
ncbi:Uncharacterised protein [Mycobacteroides abscessus subsp. abscessus]|nr:Uncharacterised protein [Mycobacteroides abscessus subsp. abscessus]